MELIIASHPVQVVSSCTEQENSEYCGTDSENINKELILWSRNTSVIQPNSTLNVATENTKLSDICQNSHANSLSTQLMCTVAF